MKKIQEKWIKRGGTESISDFDVEGISRRLSVPQTAIRIAFARGVTDFDEFFGEGTLPEGNTLAGTGAALDVIEGAIKSCSRIRVMGDYDMDGVMATNILVTGIRRCYPALTGLDGAEFVDWDIPDRHKDGYGLNVRMIDDAIRDGVELVVTCDNGISAFTGIEKAKAAGLKVVVTDHHRVPLNGNGEERLVPADAVIDPHRKDDPTEFKDVCGAVVAWKLCRELYARAFGLSRESAVKMADAELLGFAAFATITDVMPLVGENRAVVKHGLPLIGKNPGLAELCKAAELDAGNLSATDIGYTLGPCGNACGRIGDVRDIMTLLTERDKRKLAPLAEKIVNLNAKRKDMCSDGEEKAAAAAESLIESDPENSRVLVLYVPGVHEGIIGIVAGRMREKFSRPAFVFSDGNGCLKGSGRSTETWNMFDHISAHGDCFLSFGGHSSAAGCSVKDLEALEDFRRTVNADCCIADEELVKKVWYDGEIRPADLTTDLADSLSCLEPFGNGNEAPRFFIKEADATLRIMGRDGRTAKATMENGASILVFREGGELKSQAERKYGDGASEIRISAVGTAEVNEFRGNRYPQLIADAWCVPPRL